MSKSDKIEVTETTTDTTWTEAHELAALERMLAIGLRVLRARRLRADVVASNLATRAVSTEREFTTSLAKIALMTPEEIAIEVAHVRRIVTDRLGTGAPVVAPSLRDRVSAALSSASGEEHFTSDRERALHCGGQVSALKAVLAMIDEQDAPCANHTTLGYQPWCPACNPTLHRRPDDVSASTAATVPFEHPAGAPQLAFIDLRKAQRVRLSRGDDGAFVEVAVTTLGRVIVRGNPGPLVIHPLATNVVEIEDWSDSQ